MLQWSIIWQNGGGGELLPHNIRFSCTHGRDYVTLFARMLHSTLRYFSRDLHTCHKNVTLFFSWLARIPQSTLHNYFRDVHAYHTVRDTILSVTCMHTSQCVTLCLPWLAHISQATVHQSTWHHSSCKLHDSRLQTLCHTIPLVTCTHTL